MWRLRVENLEDLGRDAIDFRLRIGELTDLWHDGSSCSGPYRAQVGIRLDGWYITTLQKLS